MKNLSECFEANRAWAERKRAQEPDFFERLSKQQSPDLLWIGCSDSRLPPDRITGRQPGEVFVHRNVANVVVHTDMNCLSVLQYGIEVLGIRNIVVCGHYGCGGVRAALQPQRLGLIENWLRHIRDIYRTHSEELDAIPDEVARTDRLCELNVIEQVTNICRTTIVQDAWRNGRDVSVRGWIYSLSDGLLKDLDIAVESIDELRGLYCDPHSSARRRR